MTNKEQIQICWEDMVKAYIKARIEWHKKGEPKLFRVKRTCRLCKLFLEKECKGCVFKKYETDKAYGCHALWNMLHPHESKNIKMFPNAVIIKGQNGLDDFYVAILIFKAFFKI